MWILRTTGVSVSEMLWPNAILKLLQLHRHVKPSYVKCSSHRASCPLVATSGTWNLQQNVRKPGVRPYCTWDRVLKHRVLFHTKKNTYLRTTSMAAICTQQFIDLVQCNWCSYWSFLIWNEKSVYGTKLYSNHQTFCARGRGQLGMKTRWHQIDKEHRHTGG